VIVGAYKEGHTGVWFKGICSDKKLREGHAKESAMSDLGVKRKKKKTPMESNWKIANNGNGTEKTTGVPVFGEAREKILRGERRKGEHTLWEFKGKFHTLDSKIERRGLKRKA